MGTRQRIRVGKTEVAFVVATTILVASAIASVGWNHATDPGLTTAAAGIIGTILVRRTERRPRKDDE